MRTITIANQKGGCGKTTVAINLSASLAREGRRVLLVDLDPQAHCALGMAVPEEQIDLSILDCLLPQNHGEPLDLSRITWQIAPNLDLAPSRTNLSTLEPRLGTREDADSLLAELLKANSGRYDYCIIDCPPHIGLLMKNGLRAADEIVIPVDTGYFSLHGLTQQLASIDQLSERYGRKPVVRILANQYDVRTKLAREILAEIRKRFHGLVYESIVNFNTKLKEGASFGQPITEFAPTSMGARDFQNLAKELIGLEPEAAPTKDILDHVERLAADAERLLATTSTLVDNRTSPSASPGSSGRVTIRPPTDVPEMTPTVNEMGDIARRAIPPVTSGQESLKAPSTVPVSAPWSSSKPSAAHSTAETERKTPAQSLPAHPAPVTPPPPRGGGDMASAAPRPSLPMEAKTPNVTPWQIPKPPAATGTSAEKTESVRPSQDPARPFEPPLAAMHRSDHAEIGRKIEAIYGVRQDEDMVIFRSRHPGAGEVQLAGDFNDWMPHTTPMNRLADGDFETRLRLPRGRYRYRLVIDGRWSHDQNNPAVETNEYGELNSVVEVTK